jgi:acyl-coenzyme A synthetase/AMP-(fatty) acid ligase
MGQMSGPSHAVDRHNAIMKNWFDHILYHARMQPQRPAIVLVDRAITYGMLAAGIESCARRLVRLNLGGGAPVAIAVKSPLRQIVLSFALMRIGVPSLSLGNMLQLTTDISVAAVLADSDAGQGAGSARRTIAVTDEWFAPETQSAAPLPRGYSGSRHVCRYSISSGTTGEPKLHGETIDGLGARVFNNIFSGIDISRNGMLCMMGLSTTWGFANVCATLAAGRTLYLAVSSGEAIVMIESFSIEVLLASTEQVLSLAATARRTGAQVRSLRMTVMSGGLPTRALLEAATAYLSKDIVSLYGATEIGLVSRAMGRDLLANPGLAGIVVPGTDAAVFDAAGKPCPAGQIGSIKVRRSADPDEAAERDWIPLGDYGWFAPDGRLYVVGRSFDGAITETRVPPALEAEHVLRLEFDYDDAAALMRDGEGAGSKPAIRFAIVGNRDATAGKLQAALQARGIDVAVELFALPSIPRGPGGKVNRAQLKAALDAARPSA